MSALRSAGEVEREHLSRTGSAVRSAVLPHRRRARHARGRVERSVTRPGPSPRKLARVCGLPRLDEPPPRAIFVELQDPKSLSSIISWGRVFRDYGRHARLYLDKSPCRAVY